MKEETHLKIYGKSPLHIFVHKLLLFKKCSECGKLKECGTNTGECLECLDWKMFDLRK